MGFPGGSDGKESACSAGDPGSIPGSERSPGEENGCAPQDSCLENSMDRRAARLGGISALPAPPGLSGAFMEMCDSAKMAGSLDRPGPEVR